MQTDEPNSIQVIGRAIAVLKACEAFGPGLSLGEIARHVGLPRSTVQRIVQALAQGGFIVADGRSKSIALGPELLAMGAKATANVVEIAHPILKSLAEQTGETVDLARFNRDHMVFVDQVPGAHRLQAVSAVGDIFPMHCTANGKAALAQLSDIELQRVISEDLQSFTRNTLSTRGALMTEVNEIRTSGIAVDNEEHTLGISAVGMAFQDPARQIYSISIPIPAVRFITMRARCEPLLVEAVRNIEKSLVTQMGRAKA